MDGPLGKARHFSQWGVGLSSTWYVNKQSTGRKHTLKLWFSTCSRDPGPYLEMDKASIAWGGEGCGGVLYLMPSSGRNPGMWPLMTQFKQVPQQKTILSMMSRVLSLKNPQQKDLWSHREKGLPVACIFICCTKLFPASFI